MAKIFSSGFELTEVPSEPPKPSKRKKHAKGCKPVVVEGDLMRVITCSCQAGRITKHGMKKEAYQPLSKSPKVD